MKKFIPILVAVLVSAALVAGGWYVGYYQRVLTEAYAITVVDKQITEAAVTALIIHQLDSAQIDDARYMLRLRLDGHIAVIDSLLDTSDARTRDLAERFFMRI